MMEDLMEVENINELVFKQQANLVNTILEKENEITRLKKEEQSLSAKRKFEEKKFEKFKEKIKNILEENGIDKFETEVGTIQVRKNPISIEVEDIEKVPDEYKVVKTTVSVDKKKVTDNFKATGELIEGLKINTENTSLQVK